MQDYFTKCKSGAADAHIPSIEQDKNMKDKFTQFLPLHGQDYRSDTAHLTLEGHGAYFLLLIEQWQRGYVDEHPHSLRKVLMGGEVTETVQNVIDEFFEKTADGFVNPRLAKERIKAEEMYQSKVDRAKNATTKRKKTETLNISPHNAVADTSTITNNKELIDSNSNADKYHFCGKVVKLNSKDFDKFAKQFDLIDLEYHLRIIDEALLAGGSQKQWFQPMLYKLAYQNDKAKKAKDNSSNKSNRPVGAI